MARKCLRCGTEARFKDRFCHSCGHALPPPSEKYDEPEVVRKDYLKGIRVEYLQSVPKDEREVVLKDDQAIVLKDKPKFIRKDEQKAVRKDEPKIPRDTAPKVVGTHHSGFKKFVALIAACAVVWVMGSPFKHTEKHRTQTNVAPAQHVETPVDVQPLSPNRQAAVQSLTNFHKDITEKNFRAAYNRLSDAFQYEMSYEGWVPGFDTTVSSTVSDVQVLSESPDSIELSYVLTAVDNINGREEIAQFNGTAVVINEGGDWRIDYIKNKVR
ncbi:MAG: zinc ribbon domain-containing protein [Selenomonadaceae bacterium]|nr:zinc ribbon domain-containing protein [Selenomonadaceae bacterium]